MERLTFVDEDGRILFDNPAGFPEDVGFTIRELAKNEEWKALDNIAQRLANCEQRLKYYKDLEEQGKLLKLPVAVGDTVYIIYSDGDGSFIEEPKVEEVSTHRIWIDSMYFDYPDIGKTVFLTKESAEAALKEMSE